MLHPPPWTLNSFRNLVFNWWETLLRSRMRITSWRNRVAETYKNNEDATSLTLSGVNPDSFTRLLHSTPTPVALISDDQGNVFALLNQNTRKLATAAFLMQLVHLLYDRGAQLAPNHCKRDHNQWADELTHPAPVGFTPEKRLSLQSILLLPLQDWKTPSL